MKKFNKEEGVWRTIGGRRVFIRTGASLSQAMIDSGKFKGKLRETYQKEESEHVKNNGEKKEYYAKKVAEADRKYQKAKTEPQWDKALNEKTLWRSQYDEAKNNEESFKNLWDNPKEESNTYDLIGKHINKEQQLGSIKAKDDYEYNLYKKARMDENSIDPMTENSTDWEALDKKYKSRYEKEQNTDWRTQVKSNNELMEKELKDYETKYDPFGKNVNNEDIHDGYYEIFRNNERRNAKIKKEVPTEPYEFVEAYAGYHDKSYRLAGTKMSGKDIVEYGKNSWTGKEYTNDEFMEHLEDSNWHSERKQLLEANLTNQELEYIKNKTTLSQWGVGQELTGKANVDKMINEAREKFSSNNLIGKYKGTIDYLKQNTNMTLDEILDLLRKRGK